MRGLVIIFWFYAIINFLMLIRKDLGLTDVALYMNATIMIGLCIVIFLFDMKILESNLWTRKELREEKQDE